MESRTPPGDATIERWAERISSALKDEGGAAHDDGMARRARQMSESQTQTMDGRASEDVPPPSLPPPNREAGNQPEVRRVEQVGQPGGGVGEITPDVPTQARRRTVTVVQESVRPRVEKLRDASMGMIEEASEDTGLRFVLIAFALFLISIFLLALHSALD
jgi:hypothetical protein